MQISKTEESTEKNLLKNPEVTDHYTSYPAISLLQAFSRVLYYSVNQYPNKQGKQVFLDLYTTIKANESIWPNYTMQSLCYV